MLTFNIIYIVMASCTGVAVAAALVLVLGERRRERRQRPHAQRALANLLGSIDQS